MKKHLRRVLILCAGILAAICVVLIFGFKIPLSEIITFGYAKKPFLGKKVVWVDSYHSGYAWSDAIEKAILEKFKDTGINLKVIHFDAKRNPGEKYGKMKSAEMYDEISKFKPDLVIASDDDVQKYLIVPYFKGKVTPVLFSGVNWEATEYGYPAVNISGMIEVDLADQLVEHLKTFTKGRRVSFVTVDDITEHKHVKHYNLRFFNGALKVFWVKDKNFENYKNAFQKAQAQSDIVILGSNAGINDWDNKIAEEYFTKQTRVPTGTLLHWMAPFALITLGKVAEEHGEWPADQAIKILSGTSISEIPITDSKKGTLILNFEVSDRLHITFSPTMLKNGKAYRRDRKNL